MKIKRLEIHGFKSFLDRTTFHFGGGMTAIVGPNGCGKSNIVDAMLWCMGEQSPKHLRGKEMADVIFAGSESRPPAAMAEVSLFFEVDDRLDRPLESDGGEEVDGYDLRGAVIGSEGMFGIVTRVLLRLVRAPQAFKTLLGVFESVDDASQTVSDIIAAGMVPGAMEMMDQLITQAVEAAYHFGFPLDAGAVLIVELDGLSAGLERQAERVMEICKKNRAREVRLAKTDQERMDLWKSRKRAFGAIGRLSPNFITQDGVVPRSKLPEMMRFIRACSEKHGLRIPNVFHAGDGNIHPLVLYDEREPDQVRRALAAGHDILEKCIEMGGSVTGEHGIGVEKIDFMEKQFTANDLEAMRKLRRVFDPENRCNPHKMFPGSKRCADFAPRKQIAA